MADHHTRHNPLGQDALFTTPASLMLDARLTPLERNGWQVLRMLRSAEGISPLANLGQLRRYLTSTRWGRGPGTDGPARSRRASADGMDQPGGPAPRSSDRPCAQRAVSGSRKRLPAGLRARCQSARASASLHRPRNNQVDRVAVHIQATLAQAPEAASMVAHDQRHDDDDLPLRRRRRRTRQPTHCHCLVIPLAARLFRNRPDTLAAWRLSRAVRIRRICIKERTYRAREGNGDSASQSVSLPPCLSNAQADQQRTCRPPCAAAAAASPGSTRRVAGTQPKRHRAQCRGLLLRLGEARFCGRIPPMGRS